MNNRPNEHDRHNTGGDQMTRLSPSHETAKGSEESGEEQIIAKVGNRVESKIKEERGQPRDSEAVPDLVPEQSEHGNKEGKRRHAAKTYQDG